MERKCDECKYSSVPCYEHPCVMCYNNKKFEPRNIITNEEWFCNLSIDEKIEYIYNHISSADCLAYPGYPICYENQKLGFSCKEIIKKWLKSEHKE